MGSVCSPNYANKFVGRPERGVFMDSYLTKCVHSYYWILIGSHILAIFNEFEVQFLRSNDHKDSSSGYITWKMLQTIYIVIIEHL